MLLRVEGDSPEQPLRRLRLENVTIAHSDWELPRLSAADSMADWQAAAFLDGASLMLRHVHGAHLEDIRVVHTGGYALWLDEGTTECTLTRSV